MRVLFDHNVPRKLRNFLPDHDVKTAVEMGWAALENGELLDAAEGNFEVMVSCDKNLPYQQNLKGRELALVVLSTNYWQSLKKITGPVVAVNAAKPGSLRLVIIEVSPRT